ncbi:hypothetical protein [Actinomadura opuntiae]|nr:hypothetical protein [Actinomadura sp. OS1-43]MDL4817218.1 hypothetical protein [Actinomadura sp. OS1-43]
MPGSKVATDGGFPPGRPVRSPAARSTFNVPVTTPSVVLLYINHRRR